MAVVYLAKGRERRIQEGHPWIYRTEVTDIKGRFSPGDIVDVVNYRGKFLGRGYINPASMILVRLMTDAQEEINEDFIRRRIEAAWSYREKVLRDSESDSWRVVFGEADFLPGLIVDKFADCLVLQTLTLGIDRWKQVIVEILDELIKPAGIYERNDAPVRELEGLPVMKGWLKGKFGPEIIIKENNLRLYVDVENGQKTGYFLDQRENRAAIRYLVKGARVLDCFCHTGSFGLHAAMYGAREVIGIDISEEAISLAEKNARLNGLSDRCAFRVDNAFDALRGLVQAGESFDVVILDPPAFVKSRVTLANAIRGYKEINLRAMKLLPPGGFLVTSSCSYHLSEEAFLEVIKEAAGDAKRRLRLLELRRQAKDHPILLGYQESYYLKCAIMEVI
ncbi:MAG: rRNA (cytosine1962-C5)-methyltransferase [Clostridia bacterium]|nr:rRNA (cytosine1962-C5)-methyltransferase [Clostridia bacterium]